MTTALRIPASIAAMYEYEKSTGIQAAREVQRRLQIPQEVQRRFETPREFNRWHNVIKKISKQLDLPGSPVMNAINEQQRKNQELQHKMDMVTGPANLHGQLK